MQKLGDLSNEELLVRLRAHVAKGHVWQARLIVYLAEVERRRLDLEHACSGIWDFCIRKLGMSEGEAHRRIAAAHVIRKFPRALEYLERGDIHLSGLYALRKRLTADNHEELLREAAGKSTREIEELIASRFPKPDVPARIEPFAAQAELVMVPSNVGGAPATPASAVQSVPPVPVFAPEPRARVEPLSSTRYRVELTISSETKAKLERVKDLMRHRNPSGDLETIVDVALGLLLTKLEKERLGKTSRPRRSGHVDAQKPDVVASAGVIPMGPALDAKREEPATPEAKRPPESPARPKRTRPKRTQNVGGGTTRSKPTRFGRGSAQTRRIVFARDGEQCTYVDAQGNRCPARAYLELDHIHPRALGGSDAPDNLRVRCRAHNHLYAEQVFGRAHVAEKIHSRRRKSAPAAAPPLASVGASSPSTFELLEGALRTLGFRDPEVRRALATLEAKPEAAESSVETLLREALLLLT